MRTNRAVKRDPVQTHEGGRAVRINAEQQLRRSVLSCMLFENEHYEEGVAIADRIKEEASRVSPSVLAALAIEARTKFNLRHIPLYLTALLAQHARGTSLVSETLPHVIRRADELSEFLAVYAKVNDVKPSEPNDKTKKGFKSKLSNQVRKGLAASFCLFGEYGLAKYDRAGAVRLRDVLFLSHAKPRDAEQAALWKRLIDNELKVPDTWEVALSGGADKKETFERMIREGSLGYLALLRNLRNMEQAGCDEALVRQAILARKGGADRVLPFRYIAAATHAPRFEDAIDQSFLLSFAGAPKLKGKTVVIIDVSGSMYHSGNVSKHSDMTRAHAACALAAITREVCENPVIYATAGSDAMRVHKTELVPARRGMALASAVFAMCQPLGGGGIFLKQVMDYVSEREKNVDRVIVFTDEQDCGIRPDDLATKAQILGKDNYLINVASARNGIGYGPWTHIDGMSEHIVTWMMEFEGNDSASLHGAATNNDGAPGTSGYMSFGPKG